MVTPQLLPRPTPCPAWDLAMVPGHITDSAEAVLHEAISAGRIGIRGAPGGSGPVPPGLAAVLLATAPLLVPSDVRPGLFADPVPLQARPAPVTNSSPFSVAGHSAAIPRGPPGLHK